MARHVASSKGYLAFGWWAVCALVCVNAGRRYSSTEVALGYAWELSSWRYLHGSELGSIQLLQEAGRERGEREERPSVIK